MYSKRIHVVYIFNGKNITSYATVDDYKLVSSRAVSIMITY